MIRQANILEIPDILCITKACAAYVAGNGINQWNEQRGHHRLDDIYFPLKSNHPFHCYKLLIQFATS